MWDAGLGLFSIILPPGIKHNKTPQPGSKRSPFCDFFLKRLNTSLVSQYWHLRCFVREDRRLSVRFLSFLSQTDPLVLYTGPRSPCPWEAGLRWGPALLRQALVFVFAASQHQFHKDALGLTTCFLMPPLNTPSPDLFLISYCFLVSSTKLLCPLLAFPISYIKKKISSK